MQPRSTSTPAWTSPAAAIVAAYLEEAGGDAVLALHRAVADALTDLCEAERRTLRRDRLISHGYVRGRPDQND
ncbi:hypothetical protein ASG51_00565 [Methylobacterium sp. Leaf465]|jgi:hypothetical protein|uniref:hypothetical protein n=1 Tax=unclassified Methylobacterium TaxID=2615210 RepID=UPI0006F5233A|nr:MULTISPECIES: hypothetical protein [unclassified Methylobacterium]KQP76489.1 hypothetical protein ASF41_01465 [Methylobacterium sp. Leaf111]KQT84626.1 hypothetical protein ASG51_00565 [Methylobacterium sp. Leaf465]KQU35159.1 hypothetical protein ASG63_00490 [Methylobacterium sp. Leaf94]